MTLSGVRAFLGVLCGGAAIVSAMALALVVDYHVTGAEPVDTTALFLCLCAAFGLGALCWSERQSARNWEKAKWGGSRAGLGQSDSK